MKIIESVSHITETDAGEFIKKIQGRVQEMQNRGLYVELSYSQCMTGVFNFGVLIVGYKEA